MMNRAEMKAKLIELRFWRAYEIGDPTLSHEAAQQLRSRIQEKLAKDTFFNPGGDDVVSTEIIRYVGDKKVAYPLAIGADFRLAVCASAILLPEFLAQHPECAADSEGPLASAAASGAS